MKSVEKNVLLSVCQECFDAGRPFPKAGAPRKIKPTVVTLCGLTRFYDAFQQANYRETMAGKIVLSVGFFPHSTEQAHGETIGCTAEQKAMLDELHKRKIDLSDEILVLNVGGYIGESTRGEIEYALSRGISIRYYEHVAMPTWEQMGK